MVSGHGKELGQGRREKGKRKGRKKRPLQDFATIHHAYCVVLNPPLRKEKKYKKKKKTPKPRYERMQISNTQKQPKRQTEYETEGTG